MKINAFQLAGCENRKIMGQRKYRIYPAIVSVIVAAGAIISSIPGNSIGFTMANYPYTVLSMLAYVFAPIAVFMLVSDLVSGEMAGSEIRMLLTKPVSRVDVLLAKVLSIMGYIAALFFGQLLLSTAISVFTVGLSVNILTVIMAYAVGLLPMAALMAMSVAIATLLKSSTSSFSFSLLAYIGLMVLGVVFSGLSPAMFTSYLGMGSMVIGSTIPVAGLLMGLAVVAASTLTFLSVSGLRFVGREF